MRILDETPDELMNQVLHTGNPKARELLEDILEKERHIAQGADRTDVVAKLDEALEVVRGVNVLNNSSIFKHVSTSGAVITSEAKHGTFLIGSYPTDLIYILEELNYPKINLIDINFPVPAGQKFNLLNISDELYQQYMNSGGGFFTQVNVPWIDAAVSQGHDIIVVSDVNKFGNIYNRKIINGIIVDEITGFGKEIHRLEWTHGYRYNPTTKMMVPPNQANALPSITKLTDYTNN